MKKADCCTGQKNPKDTATKQACPYKEVQEQNTTKQEMKRRIINDMKKNELNEQENQSAVNAHNGGVSGGW